MEWESLTTASFPEKKKLYICYYYNQTILDSEIISANLLPFNKKCEFTVSRTVKLLFE